MSTEVQFVDNSTGRLVDGRGVDVPSWKVFIVDDDEQVHLVTKVALDGVSYEGRPLEFLSAYSAEEARQVLVANPDIALVLLDVVMETDDAGLRLASFIREELGNHSIQIVIRTGEAGKAPERKVVSKYSINGFRDKTELTNDKLYSTVYTALSAFQTLQRLNTEIERRNKIELLQTKRTRELKEANIKLKKFATLAAHDLKEPLRKMMVFAERFESRQRGELNADTRDFVNKVKSYTNRSLSFIDDIQSISELEKLQLTKEDTDLNAVLDVVISDLEEEIKKHDASIELGQLPLVYADRPSMELLMLNLVSNALKYRQAEVKPSIQISAELITVDGRNHHELRVSDNGIGIAPEYQDKVFDTFFRLHNKKIEGTGVGLALCKKLVDLHHGEIILISAEREGSSFIIRLPARY